MRDVLIGLGCSALVAVMYGLLIAQREDQLRRILAGRATGFARRLYVWAFVDAIRRRADAADTSYLVTLLLVLPLAFILLVLDPFMFKVEETLAKAETTKINLTRLQEIVRHKLETEADDGTQTAPDHSRRPKKSVKEELADLEAEISSAADELSEHEQALSPKSKMLQLLQIGAFVIFVVGWCTWRPFVVMRRRFAGELDRFTLRIQGLASKPELAQLAVLESKVVNENTLRAFVESASQIANRHEVPELVETFNLWPDRVPRS